MAEKILGTFTSEIRRWRLLREPCALFFTEDRLIVARTGGRLFWLAAALPVGLIICVAGGVMGNTGLAVGGLAVAILVGIFGNRLVGSLVLPKQEAQVKKLAKRPPSQILNSDRRNFDIAYANIDSIDTREARVGFRGGTVLHFINFSTREGQRKFIFEPSSYNGCLRLVRRLLPNKLTQADVGT